jgi:hypothetical protein
LRFNGSPTKQDTPFPFGNTTDNEARVFIMNVAAAITYVSRKRVSGRNDMGDIGTAAVAETNHG